MARAALLHLVRSRSTSFRSGHLADGIGPRTLTIFYKIDSNSAHQYSPTQRRFLSQPATAEVNKKISIGPHKGGDEGNQEKGPEIFYHGPISDTIKRVKLPSLSTFFISASLGPVVSFMSSQDSNFILKTVVASSVVLFSASTTAALHWFANPYVHKLRWTPGSDSFEVEMMSWLATYRSRTIKFADIKPANTNRPYVLFEANGNFYYVDEEQCHDKALMAKLTPWEQGNESAPKNS